MKERKSYFNSWDYTNMITRWKAYDESFLWLRNNTLDIDV